MAFKPTDEQLAARDAAAAGKNFVLNAGAGTGKTTACQFMTKSMKGQIGYLVYNTAAKDEALEKFKGQNNVTVKTTASLGWNAFKDEYAERMKPGAPRVPAAQVAKVLGITRPVEVGEVIFAPDMLARLTRECVDRFAYSADPVIKPQHVHLPDGLDPGQVDFMRTTITKLARRFWEKTLDPASRLPFSMDYAYKLLVHTKPQLGFDSIIVDECQDSNPATELLVKSQRGTQLIAVGDPAQAIYGWRGAVNIMDRFDGERLALTQSWRFGQEVADEATTWLDLTETGMVIKGNPFMTSVVGDDILDRADAVLCHTNGGAMAEALQLMEQGYTVGVVGGVKPLKDLAFAALDLYKGEGTKHPELIAFNTWSELMAFTEEPGGGDLKPLVRLINEHGAPVIIDACNKIVDDKKPKWGSESYTWTKPDVVVATVHKTKGLEYDSVRIGMDFESWEPEEFENPLTGLYEPGPVSATEAMLYYVGFTRTRNTLDRGGLKWADNQRSLVAKV